MRARAKGVANSPSRTIGFAFALFFLGAALVAAQNPKELTPELQKVREALDKYQDPVVAVHDGYFSTLGCVAYPISGAAGQVPYPAGGMGIHFFNDTLMGKLDPLKPQVLVYQPDRGRLR